MATILVDFCIQNQEIISFSLLRKCFKKVKNVKSYSFSLYSVFTPPLFYRLKYKLLILNNIQILAMSKTYHRHYWQWFEDYY